METPQKGWFKELRYVDFDTIAEPWNVYKLADGSTLRVKLVLTNVLFDGDFGEAIEKAKTSKMGEMKLNIAIQTSQAASVRIPKNLRGSSSSPSGPEEGPPLLAQADIDFEIVSEKWNEYKLEHGVGLKIRHTLIRVDRAMKYDEQGIPRYNIEGSLLLRIVPPK